MAPPGVEKRDGMANVVTDCHGALLYVQYRSPPCLLAWHSILPGALLLLDYDDVLRRVVAYALARPDHHSDLAHPISGILSLERKLLTRIARFIGELEMDDAFRTL